MAMIALEIAVQFVIDGVANAVPQIQALNGYEISARYFLLN